MKRHHVGISTVVIIAGLIVLFSLTIAEFCQRGERQWSGMVWGQHGFHEQPSVLVCFERIVE